MFLENRKPRTVSHAKYTRKSNKKTMVFRHIQNWNMNDAKVNDINTKLCPPLYSSTQ